MCVTGGIDGKAPIAGRVISIPDLLILPIAFYIRLHHTPAWLVVQSIIGGDRDPTMGFHRGVNEILQKQKVVSSGGHMERVMKEDKRAEEHLCH